MSIEVRNLSFSYDSTKPTLNNVSLTVRKGELLSILGCNGAGKSTLLRCMTGLLSGYSGTVGIDGKPIREMPPSKLARRLAYIPQAHYHAFNYDVFTMVLMGTSSQVSTLSRPGGKQVLRVNEALERIGIAHLADKSFNRISGGEQKLVLFARAIAQDAAILVLDEPTANLDYGNRLHVMETARALVQDGYTIIQSSHDPEQAYMFSDHVIAMKNGAVIEDGAPPDVITTALMRELYSADVEAVSLYEDKMRVILPAKFCKE